MIWWGAEGPGMGLEFPSDNPGQGWNRLPQPHSQILAASDGAPGAGFPATGP